MAKLYFRYGAMNSGKSTALMQVAHNYEEQGMRVLILKPQVDTKGGGELVSRLGVRRKADLLGLEMPDEVAEYIANRLKNNIRQLEGAVKKLNAYYMLEGIQPVISVAQNAIKDILNETQPVPVTIEKIIGEVSRTFNVSPADIRGTKRNANVASARRVAIYILREVTGMSMEEIGREFSGRDHSTIVYSLKTMERDMKNDQHLRETVSDIIKNVKA